jgi:hypothetical protein
MPRYSFKVLSSEEVLLPKYGLAIGEGIDIFSSTVDNLSDFLNLLGENQVHVKEVNNLEDLEPVTPALLTGVDPEEIPLLLPEFMTSGVG